MRNFDVKLAKKGWPVITRDGHNARVVCYDRISANGHGTLAALITFNEPINEVFVFVGADGRSDCVSEYPFDLFLTDTWEGHDENGDKIEREQSQKASTLSTQIGGDHYTKRAIQPWEYIEADGLDFFEGNVVKYVTRYKDKDGVKDLRKAKHYIEHLIEREEKK